MANQVPLSTLTDAAGGVEVPELVNSTFLLNTERHAGVAGAVAPVRTSSSQNRIPTYKGRPVWVDSAEYASVPATGAEFGKVNIDIDKAQCTVILTEELLEDAIDDVQGIVVDDILKQLPVKISANIIGLNRGVAFTSPFSSTLNAGVTQNEVISGTDGAAFFDSVLEAVGTLLTNGTPESDIHICLHPRFAQLIASSKYASDSAARLYKDFNEALPEELQNKYHWDNNYVSPGAGTTGDLVGTVGAFPTSYRYFIRRAGNLKLITEGSVNVGGEMHSMADRDGVAIKTTIRHGGGLLDPRDFVNLRLG
jgi:HK97 family phage major capsid protein